jgi:hypothetical protein
MDYSLHIVNEQEAKKMFANCLAGGVCERSSIKLFIAPDCENCEDCAVEILTHEVLHFVLDKIVGEIANEALDHIHKSFYVYDLKTKKWKFVVEFVHAKGRHIDII